MNNSFLYHAWGLYRLECTREEYKDNAIILYVQSKKRLSVCPKCGKRHLVKNGYRIRDFAGLPIGGKKVIIRMKVQRYKCKNEECDYDQQEKILFATGSRSYTHRFAKYVVGLLRGMTLQDVANHLNVTWDTIKEIHSTYLDRHYSPPSLKGVENIGIDEFAVKKGHIYKTIVVDLDTGRILYVGDGKGVDALDKFWKRVKRHKVKIEHVATDLSVAFIASVLENCPGAVHVFDHFHVVKLMNDHLDDIRRKTYAAETDVNRRKVLKGSRWLLLCNGKDVMDGTYKNRLENALDMNRDLMKAYYLKEDLIQIWLQADKRQAWKALENWCRQARDSKVNGLIQMANTLLAYRYGILAWYDIRISTAKVEGINHKVKNMMRQAYGYRDDDFFKLKLYSLHDKISSFVG